ncbi:DUF2846 domain-containing protein [Marinomonas mediterranea]|uniref:DUF2846 domain-containing protein n=1 Tax=Marinomonas mediterranea TaxID=119864 RepID=UPI00234AE28F|nr:DUF2846 domain-containing protein [Marinomonas mediterranea]WCN13646.1 DUF2846 domain-containing protein [Marinomonas mediterranea]
MKYLCIAFFILLSGCASTNKFVLDSKIDPEDLATLYVYRTDASFHSFNPEKPYIYLGDKVIAKLGTGQFKRVVIPAGNQRLSVRQPIMFMPGTESDSFKYSFESGKTYYLRYNFSFNDATFIGGTVAMTGTSDFHLTTKENYLARK